MIEVRINIEYKGQAISLSQMFGRAKDVKSLWESAKVIDGMVVEMLKRAENYLSGVFDEELDLFVTLEYLPDGSVALEILNNIIKGEIIGSGSVHLLE